MDVIEGCEVAEEKREKRVLIGFRTTEKGYRPLSVPYLSRHSNTILFVFLSRVVRFVQARESQRGDILSSPPSNIIIHEKDIWGKKKKCGVSFVKEESFPLEIVSHFLIPSLGFISWHCDRQSCRERGEYYICLPRRKPCDCRTEIPFISFHPV